MAWLEHWLLRQDWRRKRRPEWPDFALEWGQGGGLGGKKKKHFLGSLVLAFDVADLIPHL